MKLRLLSLGCFLALLVIPTAAQVTKTKGGYLFRVHFVKGQSFRYEVVSSVLVPSMRSPINVTGPFNFKVVGLQGRNGVVDAIFGPLKNGDHELMAKQSLHYVENTQGAIVGAKLPQMSVVFPASPKKPGQTWSANTSVQSVGSHSVVTANYRFEGMTVMHGKSVAKLNVKLSSTGQTDTKGSGEIYILASDGSLSSSRFHITVTAEQGPISSTMTLERQ